MFGRLKAYITSDVTNPNENADGAISLRICSLVTIAYLFVLSALVAYTQSTGLVAFNLFFMMVYVYAFWLTYHDMTKGAVLWYNLATLGFVCFDVTYIGWDSGIQHFLFMLILFNLIFTYMSKKMQGMVTTGLCIVRLVLYFYCRNHGKVVELKGIPDISLQIITTVMVFLLLFICGVMLSKDSQQMERKLKKYNEELEMAANTDTLTRLWNRHYLMHYMEKKVKEPLDFMSIAIGDIDFFKKVNDTYGHECGDEVLRSLARIIESNMEGNGVTARWGGEEFIFVFEHANGDEAMIKLSMVQDAIRNAVVKYGDLELKITMTFGLVEYDPSLMLHENIKIADDRLYVGKQSGRDRIIY